MSKSKSKFQLPALHTGPLPLLGIREEARHAFLDLLDSCPGRKALVLDPSISGPLSMLDASLNELLSEHGVVKMQYLEAGGQLPVEEAAPKAQQLQGVGSGGGPSEGQGLRGIMIITRATVENTQLIAAQLRNARARAANYAKQSGNRPGPPLDQAVIFIPRRTPACERVLEEEGVSGDVRCGELGLDMVPLEDDVLSLELDHAFKECVVDGDSGPLYAAARAILRLQAMFGLIPRIQGKGPAAVAVRDMVLRMRKENPGLIPPPSSAQGLAGSLGGRISRLILVDREVDLITPMLSQITFEGLIDEVTGIKSGGVPWTPKGQLMGHSTVSSGAPSNTGPTTLLNSSDPYFREFRDLPYHHAITRLQSAARDARKEYSELSSKGLAELKTFVKGLPKLFLLDRLTDIATPIANQVRQQMFHDRLRVELDIVEGIDIEGAAAFTEELMLRGADLLDVLRLMVTMSEAGHGIPRKAFDMLRAEVLTTYGYEHALTLGALEKAGFLRASTGGRSPFTTVRKDLDLVVLENEEGDDLQGASSTATMPSTQQPQHQQHQQQRHVLKDISQLYKGYAPLSIRLVEAAALRGGWGPITDALSLLPGSHFDVTQGCDEEGRPTDRPTPPAVLRQQQQQQQHLGRGMRSGGAPGGVSGGALSRAGVSAGSGGTNGEAGQVAQGAPGDGSGEVVLVAFLGGCTYTELSALRHLSASPASQGTQFLALTTKVVTGSSLLSGFIDPAIVRSCRATGLQV